MSGITLYEALDRIAMSDAANEGLASLCRVVMLEDHETEVEPMTVEQALRKVDQRGPAEFRVDRTLKNWQILGPEDKPAVRCHPWDESSNDVRLFGKVREAEPPVDEFVRRLRELAQDAEKHRALVPLAASLYQGAWWALRLVEREQESEEFRAKVKDLTGREL